MLVALNMNIVFSRRPFFKADTQRHKLSKLSHRLRWLTDVRYSLLHDQEERAVVPQTCGVQPRRQHIRILLLGSWQQRDVSSEGPVHCDHVGMHRQSFGEQPKISARRTNITTSGKCRIRKEL